MEVLHNVYWLVSQGVDSNTNTSHMAEKKNVPFFFKNKKIKIPSIINKVGYRILLFWIPLTFASNAITVLVVLEPGGLR